MLIRLALVVADKLKVAGLVNTGAAGGRNAAVGSGAFGAGTATLAFIDVNIMGRKVLFTAGPGTPPVLGAGGVPAGGAGTGGVAGTAGTMDWRKDCKFSD